MTRKKWIIVVAIVVGVLVLGTLITYWVSAHNLNGLTERVEAVTRNARALVKPDASLTRQEVEALAVDCSKGASTLQSQLSEVDGTAVLFGWLPQKRSELRARIEADAKWCGDTGGEAREALSAHQETGASVAEVMAQVRSSIASAKQKINATCGPDTYRAILADLEGRGKAVSSHPVLSGGESGGLIHEALIRNDRKGLGDAGKELSVVAQKVGSGLQSYMRLQKATATVVGRNSAILEKSLGFVQRIRPGLQKAMSLTSSLQDSINSLDRPIVGNFGSILGIASKVSPSIGTTVNGLKTICRTVSTASSEAEELAGRLQPMVDAIRDFNGNARGFEKILQQSRPMAEYLDRKKTVFDPALRTLKDAMQYTRELYNLAGRVRIQVAANALVNLGRVGDSMIQMAANPLEQGRAMLSDMAVSFHELDTASTGHRTLVASLWSKAPDLRINKDSIVRNGKDRSVGVAFPWLPVGIGAAFLLLTGLGTVVIVRRRRGRADESIFPPRKREDERAVVLAFSSGTLAGNELRFSGEQKLFVGRDPQQCGLIVDNNKVSRRHLEIEINGASGRVRLRDLGSSHGTRVNGVPLPPDLWRECGAGDRITLAGEEEVVIRVPGARATAGLKKARVCFVSGELAGSHFDLTGNQEIVIGRDPLVSQIIVSNSRVSRRHLSLRNLGEEGVLVRDLNSTSGTWVDGQRLPPGGGMQLTRREHLVELADRLSGFLVKRGATEVQMTDQ